MGKVHIVSRSSRPFSDRKEAGVLLGNELKKLGVDKEKPAVLGILRGGIIVAREVVRILRGDLDIVLSRKLGSPFNPELAIGAISENGELFINERIASQIGIRSQYIEEEKKKQQKVIGERIAYFRKEFPKINLKGRYVIIVDDGIATGATMEATVWSIREEKPKTLMVALPVGPEDSLQRLADDADFVLCLKVPEFFSAVGQFYQRFDQTEDEEVRQVLIEERR